MLVKVTPSTMDDLLAASAWFPLLDSGAQARVRDELREVDVPQGGALCRRGARRALDAHKCVSKRSSCRPKCSIAESLPRAI